MFLLICFQKKEKSLTAHFACRAIDCKEGLKKMPCIFLLLDMNRYSLIYL